MAAADGRFNRIRQVAPMSLAIWAHWRHLANTLCFLRPTQVAQPKRQVDRFNRFCRAF